MTNTPAVSRGSLILGLCLPLAVLVGYLLAEPLDSASVGVVLLIVSVLSIPILMRWHHPLLMLSWNACINPFFIPGRPFVWMLMALASCFFAVLARTTDANRRFLSAPPVTKSLIFMSIVVAVTAMVRGGIGLHTLGSERYGSKGYFFIGLAIIGYFAFTSQRIPKERAGFYVAMFFLSALTSVVSNLALIGGPGFYFLFELFPPDSAVIQAMSNYSLTGSGVVRIAGLSVASQALWCWLFSRYGAVGIFDFGRPWRMLLLAGAVFMGMWGGFRSSLVFFILVFLSLFWLERLWRSARVLILLALFAAGLTIGLMFFSQQLPLAIQRTLSFLPIEVDAATRQDAEYSTQWRVEMWRNVFPDVPKYFFKGKGYTLDPNDMYLANESVMRGLASPSEFAMLAGDYHNGPLSVLVPFGVYGVIAIGWFFWTALGLMRRNYRYGDPELRQINKFLFALMVGSSALLSLYLRIVVWAVVSIHRIGRIERQLERGCLPPGQD